VNEGAQLNKPIVTRAEFQQLADTRLEEAKILLDQHKWNAAYYLSGYAVELAIKACIIKHLMGRDAFPSKDLSKNCYTHSVQDLIKVADLEVTLTRARSLDVDLEANWSTVKDWSEQKRYHLIEQSDAESLYNAISDAKSGVLPWIKTHW
jgi:AbiV family abortive infection protein